MNPGEIYSDDLPQEESRDGSLLVRIHVPELNVSKCLQFPADRIIWEIKNQVLALLPKELKEGFNYGLFCPPSNGKAGKFLDEERRLGDYPFNGPVGYLELKYKRRVYKMLNLDEKQLKALHTRANLRRFIDCVNAGYLEKITKMCAKGLDPNFHCSDTGETPLTLATATKKSNKLLIALVNGGALLDYRTKDGSTALHKAVERDCLEAVTTLLELGASPNYRDGKGLTPLYLSETKRCDPKICESLLHDHATIGTKDTQGWQEVHQACRNGLVQHLELLLLYGADMDARNASGNTPLHVCAVNNQEACAKLLLYRGSQINAHNYANQTAYQVAVIAGNLELAEMIRNYKPEDAVRFHKPPRYNQRRRSGIGWGTNTLLYNLSHSDSPPSPSPSDQPFSSASSSLSEGSSSHRSHEDDISLVTDKSLGDTSDIVSDSSGVGTNSDSTVCSVDHINQTVICVEPYNSNLAGHLNIQPGDYIDIVSSTDCGFLEGYIRGTNLSGFFPSTCIREISLKEKIENTLIGGGGGGSGIMIMGINDENQNVTLRNQQNGGMGQYHQLQQQQLWHQQQMSRTMNSINMKKITLVEPRSVVLHRAKRNFGFILRGAKAASPLMDLKPSDRCPALQYLDDVDPGGVADLAGLKPGDFLLAINGQDVRCASHEHVVELIRSSGSLVSMTVVSQRVEAIPNLSNLSSNNSTNNFEQSNAVSNNIYTSRQCVTLPRKMGGIVGRVTAPTPPRRDPTTTLSVGRARAKSMVAGLESNDIEKDEEDILASTKSVSTESVHQRLPFSGVSTPTSQPRTASIKSRPTSSRITAAELEELFQRQQGENRGDNRYSAMMTTSRFQSGIDSGSSTPPVSPQKGPIVYASVADMKRKKTGGKVGTMKGKPCPIPNVNTSGLNRNFHSTPDLASQMKRSSSMLTINNWTGSIGFKGHRSQDDINTMRRHLPPPNHPPPPPPIGQVVKVEVSRKSEYESTAGLQQKIVVAAQDSEIMSSFKPASNAKLYASPQSIKTVEYRSRIDSNTGTMKKSASFHKPISNIAVNQPNQTVVHHSVQHPITVNTNNLNVQPQHQNQMAIQMTSPPIPDPDYSLSESDDDDDEENSVMLARNTKFNANNLADITQQQPIETSGTSNTSSESASSIPHSFSVDEIRNIRNKLKSSKSFPNNFSNGGNAQSNHLKPNSHQIKVIHMSAHNKNEEGDNSSSGVSSDQEMAMNNSQMTNNHNNSNNSINNSNSSSIVKPKKIFNPNEPIVDGEDEDDDDERRDDDDDDGDRSPSPPIIGFQRHNSMTRKQASLVMARVGTLQRPAVSLVQLPPPIENDSENESSITAPPPIKKFIDLQITPTNEQNSDFIVLAPPPQFCDQVDSRCDQQDQPLPPPPPPLTNLTGMQQSHQQRTVRIVGAVPKSNTIISKPQPSKW